ncbi:hypothetical protein GCM10010915_11810 [Microbacterium faecale]|uniref:Phage tail tape measure protein domain-containing protein n=1 Tax=Microbacterium faecale TaxID=1804630 RepID=A0A917DG58_9MICO|nr:phage tail tape measure protein [Microbacterium faecale]GGD33064.1 hypothetical protein GCM10010915_11810 [Microbacterium faecale]
MFDAGALIFRIQAQGAQVFRRDLAEADKAADGLGKSTERAAKGTSAFGAAADKSRRNAQGFRKELSGLSDEGQRAARDVGGALTGIGVALVATSGLAAKAAIDWESAWAGVLKTVDGTPEQLTNVQRGLRGMTGELPAAHEEIAAVAEAAGQLGVETDSVVAFTRTMIDLGETTNLSSDQAATALARFMNIMGTAQADVDRLGSAVVGLGNNYATTEAEIVEMSMRLAGAGKQVGLSEGEVLGLATALSSVGIQAEAGGSAVSKVMIDMAASVEEGGDRLGSFASIAGVSADRFAKKWRTAPAEALSMFVKGLGNAEAQGESTLGILADLEITEVRMRDALLRASAAGDLFTEAMSRGNSEFEENVALQDEAEKRYETTAAQLSMMRNNIVDIAIDMGAVFLPALKGISDAVANVTGYLSEMSPEMQGVVSVLGLGAGAVALFGGAFLLAIPKIAEFRAAQRTLQTELPRTTAAMRGVTGFLMGPWGIAIGVGIAALASFGAAKAEDEARVESYASTLSEATNEITKSTREMVAANLVAQDKGWWWDKKSVADEAEKLGLSMELITDAALGNADALQEVQDRIIVTSDNMDVLRDISAETGLSMGEVTAAAKTVEAAIRGESESIDEAIRMAEQKDAANKDVADSNEDVADSASTAADKYLEEADAANELSNTLSTLIDKLNEANGVNQDAITANSDYQATLAEVREQLEAIAAGEEGYARGLDLATEAGRENLALLQDQAKDAQEAAGAQYALDSNTADYIQRLKDGRDQFIQNARDFGATKEEAKALADQIFQIPSEKEIEILAETTSAEEAMQRLQDWMSKNPMVRKVRLDSYELEGGRTVTDGIWNAHGNVIESYANGGVREQHVAQMARAGAYRVWAEPETGGESYIPHAPAKRARSEALMAQTAQILGGTYIPSGASQHAAGSVSPASSGRAGALRLELVNRTGMNILDYVDIRIADSKQGDDDYLGGLG